MPKEREILPRKWLPSTAREEVEPGSEHGEVAA
jgi:hypothetical protein